MLVKVNGELHKERKIAKLQNEFVIGDLVIKYFFKAVK